MEEGPREDTGWVVGAWAGGFKALLVTLEPSPILTSEVSDSAKFVSWSLAFGVAFGGTRVLCAKGPDRFPQQVLSARYHASQNVLLSTDGVYAFPAKYVVVTYSLGVDSTVCALDEAARQHEILRGMRVAAHVTEVPFRATASIVDAFRSAPPKAAVKLREIST